MDKVRLGRRLGIGTRLAAKMVRERTAASGAAPGPSRPLPRPAGADARRATREVTRAAAQGGRGFVRGIWTPWASAARSLWHEITGVFFALFAAFFLESLWRTHHGWRSGPDHRHFVLYLIFALVFGWFSFTAFRTAHRTAR